MTALLQVMNWKGCERETPWKNTRKISFCGFRNMYLLNAKQESSTLYVDTVKSLRVNLRHEVR